VGQRRTADVPPAVPGGPSDGSVLRLRDVQRSAAARRCTSERTEETGRQEFAGRRVVAGEQSVPRAKQLVEGQGIVDVREDHGQFDLLSAQDAVFARLAIWNLTCSRRAGFQDCLFVLLRSL